MTTFAQRKMIKHYSKMRYSIGSLWEPGSGRAHQSLIGDRRGPPGRSGENWGDSGRYGEKLGAERMIYAAACLLAILAVGRGGLSSRRGGRGCGGVIQPRPP